MAKVVTAYFVASSRQSKHAAQALQGMERESARQSPEVRHITAANTEMGHRQALFS
jgi:hypothetical protein